MVLTLTVLAVCSRQQRERSSTTVGTTTTPVAVESLARTWLEVGAAASVHGWNSKAVHQIEIECKAYSYVQEETCGPHQSELSVLYTYTYVVRQRRNRVRFNCSVSFVGDPSGAKGRS